jgi:pimeloyl-ACP methyl ester carboxylesterase
MNSHRTTSADGTEITWYDFGGDGPDLLLAHATGFCGRIWEPVVAHLLGDFRCVAYDLRGHGRSASPAGGRAPWDWQRYADDAFAVVTAAGLDMPYGVGHSCGGATEVLLEQRSPGTFRSLYLFEPVIFTASPPTGPDPERDLAVRTRRRRPSFSSRDEALKTFALRGPFATLDPAALAAYVDHGFDAQPDGSVTLALAPDDEAEVYVMASAHDGFDHLAEITCPVTVAHGSESTSFTADHMRTVAERMSSSTFVEWHGLGHFGPLEQPAEFAEAIRKAFL